MPILRLQIKFTDEERALLQKLAAKDGMTEADYLRVCMLMDGVMGGDRDAIRIMAGKLREKVAAKMASLLRTDAPSKA